MTHIYGVNFPLVMICGEANKDSCGPEIIFCDDSVMLEIRPNIRLCSRLRQAAAPEGGVGSQVHRVLKPLFFWLLPLSPFCVVRSNEVPKKKRVWGGGRTISCCCHFLLARLAMKRVASLRMNTASLGGSRVEELHSAPSRTERVRAPRDKQGLRFKLQLQEDLCTKT